MAKDMFLYWGSGSVLCWMPMIILEEKGINDYGQKLVSFSGKEQKGEEVLKLNPRGQVPTFRDGNTVVNESGAICDYLEYKFRDQSPCLLPKDDLALRGRVLQRVYEAQNLSKALIEGIALYHYRTKPEDVDKKYLDGKKDEAREELKRWEEYLKQEGSGSYMVGKDFTMADVRFFPILAYGVRGQLDLSRFPHLKSYYDKVVNRPSITATWPPHWKESERNDFFAGV